MKPGARIFLQTVIVLIGICALVFMLWEPHLEGRNANATLFEIYFKDPFLAYAYTVSIAFFTALYQAFEALGYAQQDKTVKALRTIKYCGMILVAALVAALAYLFIVRPDDDIAGGVAVGLLLMLVSAGIATVGAVGERRVQRAGIPKG